MAASSRRNRKSLNLSLRCPISFELFNDFRFYHGGSKTRILFIIGYSVPANSKLIAQGNEFIIFTYLVRNNYKTLRHALYFKHTACLSTPTMLHIIPVTLITLSTDEIFR